MLKDQISRLTVSCYAGYRADEIPRRFRTGSLEVEIVEIVSRWQTPDARFFRVRGNDAKVYTLKHDGCIWHLE